MRVQGISGDSKKLQGTLRDSKRLHTISSNFPGLPRLREISWDFIRLFGTQKIGENIETSRYQDLKRLEKTSRDFMRLL